MTTQRRLTAATGQENSRAPSEAGDIRPSPWPPAASPHLRHPSTELSNGLLLLSFPNLQHLRGTERPSGQPQTQPTVLPRCRGDQHQTERKGTAAQTGLLQAPPVSALDGATGKGTPNTLLTLLTQDIGCFSCFPSFHLPGLFSPS